MNGGLPEHCKSQAMDGWEHRSGLLANTARCQVPAIRCKQQPTPNSQPPLLQSPSTIIIGDPSSRPSMTDSTATINCRLPTAPGCNTARLSKGRICSRSVYGSVQPTFRVLSSSVCCLCFPRHHRLTSALAITCQLASGFLRLICRPAASSARHPPSQFQLGRGMGGVVKSAWS